MATAGASAAVRAVVLEHLEAFNAHDRPRLLAGLDDQVIWSTGTTTIHGKAALAGLFDDGLWVMAPVLTVVQLLVDGDSAAAELTEVLTIEGEERRFTIAGFFLMRTGLILRAKVYREGTSDIPRPTMPT